LLLFTVLHCGSLPRNKPQGYIAHFISHEKWSKMAVNSRRNETKDGAFNTKRTLCPKQPQQQQQQ
jgi:hypothetical protein